jgi:hypothetical protein
VVLALSADCKSPGVLWKPAVLRGRIANVCGARRIAVAEHMKRIPARVAKSVLMRLNSQFRAGDDMLAIFAAHSLLSFFLSDFVEFDRNTVAHAIHLIVAGTLAVEL